MEEAKSLSAQFPSQSILAVSTLYSHIYLHSGFIAGGVVTQCYAKAEPVRMRQHVEKVYCCKLHSFIGCNEKWSRLITPVEAYPTTHTSILTYEQMYTNMLQVWAKACVSMGNTLLRRSNSHYATMWRCCCESHDLAELLIMKFIIFL